MNRLSATQIKTMNEIARDREANEKMLEVALSYYRNAENEFSKRHMELWNEILTQFELPKDVIYKTKHIDGSVCIVEKGNNDD